MARRGNTARPLEGATLFEDDYYAYSSAGPRRKGDSSAQGEWVGIIETLYSEHGYILSLLDTLQRESEKLKPGKIPDYHLLLEVVDYLTHFPGRYHHPREDLLYNGLSKSDPKFKPKYERLQREHKTLAYYNDKLFDELRRVVDGGRVNKPQLLRSINDYVVGYRRHIEYESKEIFPRAEGKLSKARLQQLDEKTRFGDDPIFGAEVQRRYERLGRRLRSRVAGVGEEIAARELTALQSAVSRVTEIMDSAQQWSADIRPFGLKTPGSAGLLCRSSRGPQPSWQSRVMNTFTRSVMKPMMRFGSVESMRGMLARMDALQEERLPEDIKSVTVSEDDFAGEWVSIKRKRPRKVVLYFPGGGFVLRTAIQHRGLVARICREANARALLVHYRLAPETPFPGGLEDCLAAYHHLLAEGIKPEDITIAGDSAGGGLVLSTLLALRDEGSPMPANGIVLSPLADLTYSGESRRFNKRRDPMLPTHRVSAMHELYIGDSIPEDRYISPVKADFDGLPPLLGQVGSTEILLDDTVLAAERAEQAGVPFYLEVWEEMPHVFQIFGLLPESDVAMERIGRFINNSELDPLPERYGRCEGRP